MISTPSTPIRARLQVMLAGTKETSASVSSAVSHTDTVALNVWLTGTRVSRSVNSADRILAPWVNILPKNLYLTKSGGFGKMLIYKKNA